MNKAQRIKVLLPDFLTSINVALGLSAVILVIQHFYLQYDNQRNFIIAAWLIIFACVIDGLDGKCARWAGKVDKFGVQYDSFADLIVFGFSTSILLYATFFKDFGLIFVPVLVLYIITSAYRLARFNCKAAVGKKKRYFEGMPTTAAGGICASLILVSDFLHRQGISGIDETPGIIIATVIIVAISFLMVSTIKFDTFNRFLLKDKHPFFTFIFVISCLILFYKFPGPTLFSLGMLYIVESLFRWCAKPFMQAEAEELPKEG